MKEQEIQNRALLFVLLLENILRAKGKRDLNITYRKGKYQWFAAGKESTLANYRMEQNYHGNTLRNRRIFYIT